MTQPTIRVLDERLITTLAAPGESVQTVALDYQVPPHAPRVVFIPADELPDYKWRAEHPGVADVPKSVQAQGDKVRRARIEAELARGARPAPRSI